MKRGLSLLLILLAGCGGDDTPPAQAPPPEAPEAAPPGTDQITMKESEFYLYDPNASVGATQKPMVTIRAGELVLGTGEGGSYAFKNVTAILHVEDRDIEFHAAEGSYEEGQRAFLRGGVSAQVDDLRIELEDIEITAPTTDTPGIAFSEQPVIVSGPGIELEAQGLRLYPDEKRLELGAGTGYLEYGRLQQ